ncbi:AAA family ATPase [Streptomyces violaceusniger]
MAPVEYMDALSQLRDIYRETSDGNAGIVLVRGGMASGKTRLLYDFLLNSRDAGALTLIAHGSQAERTVRGGVIEQILRGGGLGMDAGVDACADDGRADRLVQRVCERLLEVSRKRPVVIGVDDVHFADDVSLQALLHLHRRIHGSRILVVLNMWERSRPTMSLFCAELNRRPVHTLRLAPMSRDAVVELAAGSLGRQTALRIAPVLMEQSRGNPLLVNALVEEWSVDQVGKDGPPEPGTEFGLAVLGSLHRWEPQLLDVCHALAVLGEHATESLLVQLAQAPPEYVTEVIDILDAAGLLADGQFRHSAVRLVVLGDLAPHTRSAMHRRAAELLHQRGVSATDIAEHCLAAGGISGPFQIRTLREAARQALATDRPARAQRYLELGLAACDDEQERLELTRACAEVAWRVHPSTAAYSSAAVLDRDLGALTSRDAVTVVQRSLWHGEFDTAARVLARLGESGVLPEPQVSAELRLTLHWYYGATVDRSCGPVDITALGEHWTPADDPWTAIADSLSTLWTGADSKEAVDSAEHVLRSFRLDEIGLEVLATALLALAYAGEGDEAARQCDRLIDEAVRRGGVTWQALLRAVRAEIALSQDDPGSATTQAVQALQLLRPGEWGVLIGYPLTCLLLADAARGRADAIAEPQRLIVPEAMFGTVIGLRYLHARGKYYLATGHLLTAITDLQACRQIMRDRGLGAPMLVPVDSDLAEARMALGAPEPPVLSDAERRVAVLAADGHSNREISRKLWITVSTVEQHLTRVYRKLEVSGRPQLQDRLARWSSVGAQPRGA